MRLFAVYRRPEEISINAAFLLISPAIVFSCCSPMCRSDASVEIQPRHFISGEYQNQTSFLTLSSDFFNSFSRGV